MEPRALCTEDELFLSPKPSSIFFMMAQSCHLTLCHFFSIMAYSCHRIWHERHMMLCHLNPLVKGTHPLWWFESLSLGSCGVCRGLRVRPKTGGDPQYAPPVLGLNPRLSQLCMVFISPPFLFLLLSNPFFWPLPRLWELFERMKGWLWVNSEQYSPD